MAGEHRKRRNARQMAGIGEFRLKIRRLEGTPVQIRLSENSLGRVSWRVGREPERSRPKWPVSTGSAARPVRWPA